VARKKLVEEILDRIVDRGFLTMGDLRDALSRNNLKLPDLTSVKQFLLGDQLLQADKQLASSLDGVYHGGEVYLRWPQRLSSLAFGTPLGRSLTRYVAIPFGGAFLMLEFLQHVVVHTFSSEATLHLNRFPAVFSLGCVLLLSLYYERFRALGLDAMVRAGRVFRRLLVDVPTWALKLDWVKRLRQSRPYWLFKRYFFRPLLATALAAPVIAAVSNGEVTLVGSFGIFVVVNLLLNSPIGRNVDEMVTDWIVQTWHHIRIHFFAAVFRLIMDVFNRILETIERLLYTVDEWLRFRAGERRSATAAKAVLGFVWFFVNYVIRFCVTLLLEPQFNPIKHFPVVTVSHKIMSPLLFPPLLATLEVPLGKAWASLVAGTTVFLLPGVFGFLVWELKENWRLYAANRPANLQPVGIGHHGETLLQFLRPGFRSGTIPKLYSKLRRASRKALYTDQWKSCIKQLDGLHHASDALRRFVDRELLALLHESRTWADRSVTTGEIRLGYNRILVELYYPDLAEDSMWLAFEEQAGWLLASIHHRGWADALSVPRRQTLASALAGFYKMGGVDLVREQIESRLEPGSRGYDVSNDALIVWSMDNRVQRFYALRDWPGLEYVHDPAGLPAKPTSADRDHWVFAATPISWRRWVITWELDQLDGVSTHQVLENIYLLPS
jgi:hypothetical protein